jgi:hypothetical protein
MPLIVEQLEAAKLGISTDGESQNLRKPAVLPGQSSSDNGFLTNLQLIAQQQKLFGKVYCSGACI